MYIQGFVIPVPADGERAFCDLAAKTAPVFSEYGARSLVECWGDDVPVGEQTDFRRAVQAHDTETVAFSWLLWPDRATCDRAAEAMRTDPRAAPPDPMPFDGRRMIFGGFAVALDTGPAPAPGYVDGFVAAVPTANRQAYVDHARVTAGIFAAHGATRTVEGWGEDVPDGQVTDFRRAVHARDHETVVFAWIEWPTRDARNTGMTAAMDDPRLRAMAMPFDGRRMIFGGFRPVFQA